MAIDIKKTESLAELFAPYAPLYAVGGFVRDKLLGYVPDELDICAPLGVEDVKSVLSGSLFNVGDKNLRVGTVLVTAENFHAEYTCFREDSYADGSGKHTPDTVVFSKDIKKDALRRDFKCNALYLNPLSGEITDPTGGGLDDVKNKILSAADSPEKVFGADGLRILRLVRFHAELGFEVEENTLKSAAENAWRVKDIVPERILAELDKIFVADTKHGEVGAHFKGITLMDRLGLIDLLLPELATLRGLSQPARYHLYDAFNHSLAAFKNAPPQIRWAALLHDVGKARSVEMYGNMHRHVELGLEMCDAVFKRLKFPKARAARVKALIENHMLDINKNMSENKLKWFVCRNLPIIGDLIALQHADASASAHKDDFENRLEKVYNQMKADNTPLSVKDLPVGGKDLIEAGIDAAERGRVMQQLLRESVMNPLLRERERALAYLKKAAETRS
jgi:tRNA nucleotidyltransferase (CCA-adding enzyme)